MMMTMVVVVVVVVMMMMVTMIMSKALRVKDAERHTGRRRQGHVFGGGGNS